MKDKTSLIIICVLIFGMVLSVSISFSKFVNSDYKYINGYELGFKTGREEISSNSTDFRDGFELGLKRGRESEKAKVTND